MSKEITPRAQDYSQWYNDLVIKGSLADHSAVRGCMVIKPYGFALWENMRDVLDKMFKDKQKSVKAIDHYTKILKEYKLMSEEL